MSVKMTDRQLSFWRELLAPFAPSELSEVPARGSKKTLTYIDKRALSNRLDSVCGPHGWFVEYEATNRGYKCRLHILVPTENGSSVFMYKEDGAGFEEMGSTNKQTGEFEYDVDNDEKSGYTNAFRRAAQDAWGIGRYLYKKGIPSFMDPDAVAGAPAVLPRSSNVTTPVSEHSRPPAPAPAPAKTYDEAYNRSQAPAQPDGQRPEFNNFKIPKPGKSVFAWAKEMEKAFETRLINGMQVDATDMGIPTVFADWNEEQVNTICMNVIGHIKTLPTYQGQFDHIDVVSGQDEQPVQQPASVEPPPVAGVAAMRKRLMSLMQEHVVKSIGRQAEAHELKAAFGQIASHCPNSAGNMGEIPESLAGLNDVTWLENMIRFVEDQIRNSVAPSVPAKSSEIPF